MTEITETWPPTRQGVADLLKRCQVFISYDNFTALTDEAYLCGCQVRIIGEDIPEREQYGDAIRNFGAQLLNFIQLTQEEKNFNLPEANDHSKIAFGCLVNSFMRLDMVLRKSQIGGIPVYTITLADSATKGLNKLLDILAGKGMEIAVLTHQDMFYGPRFIDQMKRQIALLPDTWVVAGIIGKDEHGLVCGKFHDMRTPMHMRSDHKFPAPCSCIDECCMIVNLKSGFRFDEALEGFDLYGTLAVLQAQEIGTAWIIDCFAEHYCSRSWEWFPDEKFQESWRWLYERFPGKKIDTTVLAGSGNND